MKLYDCFPLGFASEIPLLEIRLNYLNDFVSHYVIVEADKTQSGLSKPFHFEENKERFAPFLHKIIYVKLRVDTEVVQPGWPMENFQRNTILRGLESANADDICLVSDLDEFPNKETLKENMMSVYNLIRTVSFRCLHSCYFVDLYAPFKLWYGSVLTTIRQARTQTPQGLRNNKDHCEHVIGGNHLSWLGGFEAFKKKNISCVEPYSKNLDFVELERLYGEAAKDGGYFLHSDRIDYRSVPLVRLRHEMLPSYLVENKDKYKELFLK